MIYTIIESAKLNRLDPEAYLASILDRLAGAIQSTASTSFCLGTSNCRSQPPPKPKSRQLVGALYIPDLPNSSLNNRLLAARPSSVSTMDFALPTGS